MFMYVGIYLYINCYYAKYILIILCILGSLHVGNYIIVSDSMCANVYIFVVS